MTQRIFTSILLLFSAHLLNAQDIPEPTKASDIIAALEQRVTKHVLQNIEFESVGPTIMGGRVVDLEVHPDDPSVFLIAYASGGLWVTENNGQSYRPIFDNHLTVGIGDIAVDWKSDVIWIGSGENNSSRSSYAGLGMFVSKDQGKTWQHKGLPESHHIGRIVLHPENPDIVWVAAMGHLYSDNEERGIYKTTNGGSSWEKVLYIDEGTGFIDLVMDPKDPKVLYASAWKRERKAWNFTESGSTSGIYKSVDGGENWESISTKESGFPVGEGVGRIGLAVSNQNSNKVYALLDNQFRRGPEADDKKGLSKDDLKTMDKTSFLALKKEKVAEFLSDNHFPKKYSADTVLSMVKSDLIEVKDLAIYLEDANSMLFDTKVIGAEVYVSNDAGKSWSKTHESYIDDLVHSYGYYFGQIRVSPQDDQKIFITGVPLLRSDDGGKTFKSVNGDNQHVDHHALWINPTKDDHLINGNDGGVNISRDGGQNWLKVKSPPVGQFYTVNVDHAKPYNIYGGLQDNGVWKGPSTYKEGSSWQAWGQYPYKAILWGDGFKVEIDNRDNDLTYTGYQFGNYFRFKSSGGRKKRITPVHELGERPLRFNWQTPIHLSRHNQDILYFGSNKFHRSLNKGDDYDLTSKDLTKGGKKGDVAYGTITSIHESPMVFGKIYLGTDDGLVYRSDDVGYQWKKLIDGLPENLWVTCVQASAHDTNRVYLSLNGYRWDHFESYVYRSENGGEDWIRIGLKLPKEPVNVIKEDPANENIVYVGTDLGLYISIDGGEKFNYINKGIPSVAVHDLVVQNDAHDLVVATHGRSIYKTDITHLQKLNKKILEKGIHLFKLTSVKYNKNWGVQGNAWRELKEPELHLPLYVKESGKYTWSIQAGKVEVYSQTDTLDYGLNELTYNLHIKPSASKKYQSTLDGVFRADFDQAKNGTYYLRPGTYTFKIEGNGYESTSDFKIEAPKKK